MSDQAAPAQPRITARVIRQALFLTGVFAIIGATLGPTGFDDLSRRFAEGHPHAPDLSRIARAPMVIQLHLATVLLGFGIGTLQMVGVKGTPMHRALGWSFVLFMAFTALDALFIKDGPTWRFTPLQLFVPMVLIVVPVAVLAARRHDAAAHARWMRGLYYGGLFWAGLLAFLPGRLLWNVFFG